MEWISTIVLTSSVESDHSEVIRNELSVVCIYHSEWVSTMGAISAITSFLTGRFWQCDWLAIMLMPKFLLFHN